MGSRCAHRSAEASETQRFQTLRGTQVSTTGQFVICNFGHNPISMRETFLLHLITENSNSQFQLRNKSKSSEKLHYL